MGISMKRVNTILIIFLILSFLTMVTGFFLYANFVPIQDIELSSKAELLEVHKELAINYSLGNVLYHGGGFIFVLCSALLIIKAFYFKFIKKCNSIETNL